MFDGDLFYLLLFSSILIFLGSIVIFRFDLLQPTVIITGTMSFSILLAVLNIDRWNISVGINTYFCIIIAMLTFLAGNIWITKCFFLSENNTLANVVAKRYNCNDILLGIAFFIECACAYLNFREMYDLSVSLGNTQGTAGIIPVVRQAIEHHQVELSKWMNYRFLVSQMLTYTYLFVFLKNTLLGKFRFSDLKLLILLIPFFPLIVLTTGRMALISLVIFAVITFSVLYEKINGYSERSKYKIALILGIGAVLFFIFFLFVGEFSGKRATDTRTPFIILSHYAGLSIAALDTSLTRTLMESPYIGSNTLLGIYRIISKLGFSVPEVQVFLPFVQFENIDTNVYTAEGRYVWDFGYLGMAIIMWLLSCFYSFLYGHLKYSKNTGFLLIFYGSICNPLFLSSIDERFFLDLVGTPILYNFVLSFLFYKVIVRTSKLDD